jgi:hypothetical protein
MIVHLCLEKRFELAVKVETMLLDLACIFASLKNLLCYWHRRIEKSRLKLVYQVGFCRKVRDDQRLVIRE